MHYNIGHLQAPASNTKKPAGRYVVALNKWSVDRFPPLGTLHPQNLQLIDISGPKMKLLSDTPTIGEPHNSMMIPVEVLQPWTAYPEVGWDAATMARSEHATQQGKESVTRDGSTVTVAAFPGSAFAEARTSRNASTFPEKPLSSKAPMGSALLSGKRSYTSPETTTSPGVQIDCSRDAMFTVGPMAV